MIIILKLILSVSLLVGIFLAFRYRLILEQWANNQPKSFFWVSVLVLRIIPFLCIYVWLNQDARSDVGMFYDSALAAQKLLFVYRDFDTAYQPLFPYITALPLWLWNSPKAIIAEMILIECAILYLNVWIAKRSDNEANVLFKSLIYLLLPAPFVLSVLGGQEDIWMWGFCLLAMLVTVDNDTKKALIHRIPARYSSLIMSIILGLSLIVTKVVIVLLLPAIFIFIKDKFKFIMGLVAVGLPTLGILYVHSEWAFLKIIDQANDPRTPNIWSILNPFLNVYKTVGIGILNWIGLASIVGISIFVALRLRKNTNFNHFLPRLWVITFCWFMLVQQSALANYAYIYLMPLTFFLWNGQWNTPFKVLLLFNFSVVIQPALWWGLNMPLFTAHDLLAPKNLIEYVFEIIMVGCLGYLLKWGIGELENH